MGARRPNPKLAKIHRTYTVDEVARLYGVHRNTVRGWMRRGLPCIDRIRPLLIRGQDLVDFLRTRSHAAKRPCQPGQLYCMRCREPRQPVGGQAVYVASTPTLGNLTGRCPSCNSSMFRRASRAKLAQIGGPLTILEADAQRHIGESARPSVNSDFKQETPEP